MFAIVAERHEQQNAGRLPEHHLCESVCAPLQDVHSSTESWTAGDHKALARFSTLYQQAGLYYAYDIIHRTLTSPFPVADARLVFNAASFLCSHLLQDEVPPGMSLCSITMVLAQEAERQGAWKVARLAYAKLQSLHVRPGTCDAHACLPACLPPAYDCQP
jgi:hypothetical protein